MQYTACASFVLTHPFDVFHHIAQVLLFPACSEDALHGLAAAAAPKPCLQRDGSSRDSASSGDEGYVVLSRSDTEEGVEAMSEDGSASGRTASMETLSSSERCAGNNGTTLKGKKGFVDGELNIVVDVVRVKVAHAIGNSMDTQIMTMYTAYQRQPYYWVLELTRCLNAIPAA